MAKNSDPYEINIAGAAKRDLKKLKNNAIVLASIDATIVALASDPRPNGIEPVGDDVFRVRDGEYRILYKIDDTNRVVLITRVRDRKEVYKNR